MFDLVFNPNSKERHAPTPPLMGTGRACSRRAPSETGDEVVVFVGTSRGGREEPQCPAYSERLAKKGGAEKPQ